MFTDLELNVKLIIGAVVAILIAVAVFIFIHRGHEVKELQQQAVVQQFTNGNLQNTIEMDNQAAAISENTQVDAANAADNVVATQNAIEQDVQVKEADIHRHYAKSVPVVADKSPQSDAPPAAKHEAAAEAMVDVHTDEANAVSAVRLGGLWQSWCQATGNTAQAQCQAQ